MVTTQSLVPPARAHPAIATPAVDTPAIGAPEAPRPAATGDASPAMAAPSLPDGGELTLRSFRSLYEANSGAAQGAGLLIEESIAGRAGPIRLRRFLPTARSSEARPGILFLHGGGWVAGSLDSHDGLCRRIAQLTGLQVVAADYRLAPEHPFPAAVEDAIDSYAMLLMRAKEWGIDPARIAVMGDGAGGTLAAVVALHARDLCLPMPVAQLLLYPLTDMAAVRDGELDSPLSPAVLQWLHRHYVPDDIDPSDWRLSPLRADHLLGLPPTFLAVARHDPLLAETEAYAARLAAERVPILLRRDSGKARSVPALIEGDHAAATCLEAAAAFLTARLAEAEPRVTV